MRDRQQAVDIAALVVAAVPLDLEPARTGTGRQGQEEQMERADRATLRSHGSPLKPSTVCGRRERPHTNVRKPVRCSSLNLRPRKEPFDERVQAQCSGGMLAPHRSRIMRQKSLMCASVFLQRSY